MKFGKNNLITDVDGLMVGHAQDDQVKSGTTVILADQPMTASVHVMGGAPGTRETDLLAPDKLVDDIDALVLSGGSALGLDAASGVANSLRQAGRGYDVQGQKVPIVPAAILFDLLNGGDKDWAENPYAALGATALKNAGKECAIGSVGAGTGACIADMKGGIGSASVVLDQGFTVGAIVAVNAYGSVTPKDCPHFYAAGWELDDESGGLGSIPDHWDMTPNTKSSLSGRENTTIAVIATDAQLNKAQCQRMAIAAHDGMARAIFPSHTLFDGDLVFAASTRKRDLTDDPMTDQLALGHAAAIVLSRAIMRAIWAATPAPGDLLPTFRQKHRL